MQLESQKVSQTYDPVQSPQTKKKYAKITPQLKKTFLSKIIFQNLSIKDAAQWVHINYSSAKAIASQLKKSKIAHKNNDIKNNITIDSSNSCSFRCLGQGQRENGVRMICSSIGGYVVSERMIAKRKIISKVGAAFRVPFSFGDGLKDQENVVESTGEI